MKIHLDTDIGGDMDDLCALVMLLKWPDLDITGITTVAEDGGRRAGFVQHVLQMAGRTDISFAAGADVSGGYYAYMPGYPPDEDNWGESIPRRPGDIDAALDLLKASIDQGAVIVGIGQYTNFRLLDEKYPGILQQAKLFLMGGFMGWDFRFVPLWNNEDDYNVQLDQKSSLYVYQHAQMPTLIPLAQTGKTALRQVHLPRMARAGVLGKLLVQQAEYCAKTERMAEKYGKRPAMHPDMINFLHDPLACAIALGWNDTVRIETMTIKFNLIRGVIYEQQSKKGIPVNVVRQINGDTFNEFWCEMVCR